MWKSSHKAPWVTRLEHVCLIHMTVAEKKPGLCRSKYSSGRLGRAHPSWTPQVCTCLSKCGWSANGFYHRTVLAQANCTLKFPPTPSTALTAPGLRITSGIVAFNSTVPYIHKKGQRHLSMTGPDIKFRPIDPFLCEKTRLFDSRINMQTANSLLSFSSHDFAAKKLWEILM